MTTLINPNTSASHHTPPLLRPPTPSIRLYPLSNYTFGTKETQPEEDPSVLARLARLENDYANHGMRRTAEAS
ncbi:uncharacterized protein AB675_4705 [Cyphellophora attinorum]|uniref:Uncharacterized protein n=1 Tax=Cyphellophora attinorum TaxID=1664694 RepID=A0A0N1H353_9EURO|nr:uncharacterized protein AB675_4705 [Phialophora attinorum]KPI39184.1 hypothetical protein AB675_4705 [Phialophora attinorum]